MRKTELLVPANNLEVLRTAVIYGADAVYIGGEAFGLRAKVKNFSLEDMKEGIAFAHERGVKVYVTANILAHNYDLEGARAYFRELKEIGPDALIIADPGMFTIAKEECPEIEIHISTQANNTNYLTYQFWHKMGAARVVSARELSLREIKEIRENIPDDLEIESFIHGAMCISYSGRCLLSNYFTGRDANHGACTHPCRWKYAVVEEKRPGEYFPINEEDNTTYIMNSKDMCMIEHIPELIDAGISSFKIEGRMKSAYYAGAVTNAYRHAIDDVLAGRGVNPVWIEETEKLSHRPYSTGFYYGQPGQYTSDSAYFSGAEVCAVVESCDSEGNALLTQRNKFCEGDIIELMTKDNEPIAFTATGMKLPDGTSIDSTPRAMMEFTMKLPVACDKFSVLRRLKEDPLKIRTNGRYAKKD